MCEFCSNCGVKLEPSATYFITDVDENYLWSCACGKKYEVEHDCYEDGCTDYLVSVEEEPGNK